MEISVFVFEHITQIASAVVKCSFVDVVTYHTFWSPSDLTMHPDDVLFAVFVNVPDCVGAIEGSSAYPFVF